MDLKRLFPLSGIAFVALVVLSLGIGGGTPASDAPAAELASFYGENTVRQGITAFVLAATVPFLIFFAISLARGGQTRTEAGSAWSQVVIAGAILTGAGILATAFVHFALADAGDSEVTPIALQALNALDGNSWMAFNAGFGVMMLGAAGLFVSNAGRQRWLGWIALVLGVALFLPFADFFALLLTLVWILVTSMTMARGARMVGHAVPAHAA